MPFTSATDALGLKLGAFSLTSAADAITKTMIAVLTLIGAALVVVGLLRAWRGRRRAQVVIEDVTAVDGIPSSASSGLSRQLRQAVRGALSQESRAGSHSALETLEQDIKGGLLRAHGSVQVRTITAGLRSTTEDSLTVLEAGVRAVAPKEAAGFLAALDAALPAQRGWTIRVFPVLRGFESRAEVGLAVELGEFGHPPDAVTTFWIGLQAAQSAASNEAQTAAIRSSLYRLLEPTALWIAIRLVSRQLAQSGVPKRWRMLSRKRLTRELAGLQMQLAGQLSLYATRKQKEFDRGFAEQALDDLADSAELLSEYFRPHSTAANVHERLGWSCRRSGEMQKAADEFSQSVHGYDEAARLLAESSGSNPDERKAALERIKVRRTKCRLLSGDPGQVTIARQELVELSHMTATTAQDLYNGACLFAVAVACLDAPREKESRYSRFAWLLLGRSLLAGGVKGLWGLAMTDVGTPGGKESRYSRFAWLLLGRSLLAGGVKGPWALAMTDVELDALDERQRGCFCDELKARHHKLTPLLGESAIPLVRDAMLAIGIAPLESR